jgi:hypothetical protein
LTNDEPPTEQVANFAAQKPGKSFPAHRLRALATRARTAGRCRLVGNTFLSRGDFMRRFVLAVLIALALMALAVPAAWAGSPHFVGAPTVTVSGNTLTVQAKEAGLGDEAQITAVLSGTADCINNGGNHPKAVNKTSFSASSVVPVQNGKADYTISVTATFSPSCSPPMTVQFTSATLTDTTNNLSVRLI